MQHKLFLNQLDAVSRTRTGRQRKLSVKTVLSPGFYRILEVLRVEWNSTLRLASTPERKMKI